MRVLAEKTIRYQLQLHERTVPLTREAITIENPDVRQSQLDAIHAFQEPYNRVLFAMHQLAREQGRVPYWLTRAEGV